MGRKSSVAGSGIRGEEGTIFFQVEMRDPGIAGGPPHLTISGWSSSVVRDFTKIPKAVAKSLKKELGMYTAEVFETWNDRYHSSCGCVCLMCLSVLCLPCGCYKCCKDSNEEKRCTKMVNDTIRAFCVMKNDANDLGIKFYVKPAQDKERFDTVVLIAEEPVVLPTLELDAMSVKLLTEEEKSYKTWTIEQVADWLSSKGFSAFSEDFEENLIDGKALSELTKDQLRSALDEPDPLDFENLMDRIEELRKVDVIEQREKEEQRIEAANKAASSSQGEGSLRVPDSSHHRRESTVVEFEIVDHM